MFNTSQPQHSPGFVLPCDGSSSNDDNKLHFGGHSASAIELGESSGGTKPCLDEAPSSHNEEGLEPMDIEYMTPGESSSGSKKKRKKRNKKNRLEDGSWTNAEMDKTTPAPVKDRKSDLDRRSVCGGGMASIYEKDEFKSPQVQHARSFQNDGCSVNSREPCFNGKVTSMHGATPKKGSKPIDSTAARSASTFTCGDAYSGGTKRPYRAISPTKDYKDDYEAEFKKFLGITDAPAPNSHNAAKDAKKDKGKGTEIRALKSETPGRLIALTLMSPEKGSTVLHVPCTMSIHSLMDTIHEIWDIPQLDMRLLHAGSSSRRLEDAGKKTLVDNGILGDYVLDVVRLPAVISISVCKQKQTFNVKVRPTLDTGRLIRAVAEFWNMKESDVRLFFDGSQISSGERLADLGVMDGDEIYAMEAQVGGKPVITLYSDKPLSATVNITLDTIYWTFSYIYPAPIQHVSHLDQVSNEWTVTDINPTGSLTVKDHGPTSYLFWEAKTIDIHPILPFDDHTFTLTQPSFVSVITHLMRKMGFGVKEIDDFITYWHPQLHHHRIKVRVLTQIEYENVAKLCVVPNPDLVVRFFAQFGAGGEKDQVGDMFDTVDEKFVEKEARRVLGDVALGTPDASFRVYEWGGMLVKN